MTTDDPIRSESRERFWPLALAVLATLVVFLPALTGELVYDDLELVAGNPLLQSFANIPRMFTTPYLDVFDPDGAQRIGYWRPLTSVAMALANISGGGSPAAFHALSLLFHLGAVVTVFAIVRRLGSDSLVAGGTALLFGLHPVHVESVAWISAMNDPLFGFLSLLSIERFLAWRDARSDSLPVAAGLLFLAALLAKELAVATLPILICLDWARQRSAGGAGRSSPVRGYVVLLVAFVGYWFARALVFGDWKAGFDRTTTELEAGAVRSAALVVEVIGGSLALLAWPAELSLFHPIQPEVGLGDRHLVVAIALVLAFAVAAVGLALRRRRLALGALLVVVAALLPVLVRVRALGPFPLSERFLYLAVLGFVFPLTLLLNRSLRAPLATLAVAAVAVGYGARSFARIGDWENEVALFRSAAAVAPESPYVQWSLGRALRDASRSDPSGELLAEAESAFETADTLVHRANSGDGSIYATDHDDLQARLGSALCELDTVNPEDLVEIDALAKVFRSIAADHPDRADAFVGLGAARFLSRDLDRAQAAFRQAIELEPRHADAHYNLGLVLEELGNASEARTHYEAALAERPRRVNEHVALARVALTEENYLEAERCVARARELAPDYFEVVFMEGMLAANDGELQEALALFDEVIEREPAYGPAHLNRAKALLKLERREEAYAALERAAEHSPNSFDAHYNLGVLMIEDGRVREAAPHLIRAYELTRVDKYLVALQGALSDLLGGNEEQAVDDAMIDQLFSLAAIDTRRARANAAKSWRLRAAELSQRR